MIQVLLVINYFNQPYYSYGKKSILAGFCAFISLFWKKEKKNKNLCFSSSVCIVYWWFIRNGFQCLRYWPGRHTKASSTGVKPRRSPTGFPLCVSQAPPHTLSPIAGSVSRHFLRGPGQGALADRLRLSAPRSLRVLCHGAWRSQLSLCLHLFSAIYFKIPDKLHRSVGCGFCPLGRDQE